MDGSNGALLHLGQMGGYCQTANYKGNLKLLLLNHEEPNFLGFRAEDLSTLTISTSDAQLLATLIIVLKMPRFLGERGTSSVYKTPFSKYNFTYKVMEQTF